MADQEGNRDGLWTTEEVAEYLQVSAGTVSNWVKERSIPVVKVGKLNRFRREDIDAWLAERARPAEKIG